MKKIYLLFAALIAGVCFFTGCNKDEFIVTFNPNGGKGALITQNFTEKVSQSLMANTFTYRGNTFSGWNTKADGSGTAYKDQESIKVIGHLVLYAQWLPASGSFTVTFKANGGIGEMSPQTFEAGEPQSLSPNAFYYQNYYFLGWNTDPNGRGRDFENEQHITLSADMTLYAQWEIYYNTYFVLFDANGGEGTMEPQAFKKNESKKLNANTFTRESYIFKNWNTKADGSGYSIVDEYSIQIGSNLMLYAQWINPEDVFSVSCIKD